MTLLWPRLYLAVLTIMFGPSMGSAQTPDSLSGEITVQVLQGLDSSVNPRGGAQGTVTKSTAPAVPAGSAVMLGIVPDPADGGYTTQVAAVMVNGRTLPAASSSAALGTNIRIPLLGPKLSVSGARVFLPPQTFVKFMLAPPPATPARPRPQPIPLASAPPTAPALPAFVRWSQALESPQTSDVKTSCEATDNTSQAYCFAVLTTLYDVDQAAADTEGYVPSHCFPANMTAAQLRDAFLAGTRRMPDQLSGPITIFYGSVMPDIFPCPKAPAKKHAPAAKRKS